MTNLIDTCDEIVKTAEEKAAYDSSSDVDQDFVPEGPLHIGSISPDLLLMDVCVQMLEMTRRLGLQRGKIRLANYAFESLPIPLSRHSEQMDRYLIVNVREPVEDVQFKHDMSVLKESLADLRGYFTKEWSKISKDGHIYYSLPISLDAHICDAKSLMLYTIRQDVKMVDAFVVNEFPSSLLVQEEALNQFVAPLGITREHIDAAIRERARTLN